MRKLVLLLIVLLFIVEGFYKANNLEFEREALPQIKDFQGSDIRDRKVNTFGLKGRVIIVGFSTQETSDYLIEWQTKVGYETGITLKGYKDIFTISVADVSSFPWIVRPIVRSRFKGIYEKANERLFERFKEHKTGPPEDLKDRIYLIPDWAGEILKTFSIEEKMDEPHLFIIDQNGRVVGHFTQNTDANNNKIFTMVKNLLEKKAI